MIGRRYILMSFLFLFQCSLSQAFELKLQKLNDEIYALVGEIGPRSKDNHALNNTLGFIITEQGVILVGSGATPQGAALIEQTIEKVTKQPVRWVINIGTQDHHWLGNSYFSEKGAEIIALQRTVNGQKKHLNDHLQRLAKLLPDEEKTVKAVYANKAYKNDEIELSLGDVSLQLIWTGGGHFLEDAYLWLPNDKVVFSGDVVFHDRMLGIQTHTPVNELRKAFDNIQKLKPDFIIPGHGYAGNLLKSQNDSGNYINWLIDKVKAAQDDWKDISETTDLLENAPEFKHLKFYEGWHRRNINRVYLYLEAQ